MSSSVKKLIFLMLGSFILTFCSNTGSEVKDNVASIYEPTLVEIEALLSGIPSLDLPNARLIETNFEITDCALTADNGPIATIAQQSRVQLSLRKGNEGCKIKLDSFTYGNFYEAHTYKPANSVQTLNSYFDEILFNSDTTSYTFFVSISKNLSLTLDGSEHIKFYLMPAFMQNLEELPYLNSGDFLPATISAPEISVNLYGLIDEGVISEGVHGLYIVFSCEVLREFEVCNDTSLLDYRVKIIPTPETALTLDEAANWFRRIDYKTLRPTTQHLVDNGFGMHVLVPKDSEGDFALDATFILQYNGQYRFFDVDLRTVLDIFNSE